MKKILKGSIIITEDDIVAIEKVHNYMYEKCNVPLNDENMAALRDLTQRMYKIIIKNRINEEDKKNA